MVKQKMTDKPEVIVFDLDGTLADISHRLHFIDKSREGGPDWTSFLATCEFDELIEPMAKVFRALKDAGHHIIILTGRSSAVRYFTMRWLADHDLRPDQVIMRPEKDYTPDHKLKLQMIQEVQKYCKIIMAFEDRARVVEMWRAQGILCAQVADGDF